jgi:hypothetical protein
MHYLKATCSVASFANAGVVNRYRGAGANPTNFEFTATYNASYIVPSRLEGFKEGTFFILETRYDISCVVNSYSTGIVTQGLM